MNTSLKWQITASFMDCDHIGGTATRSVDVPFMTRGIVGATVTLHLGSNKYVVNFGWDHPFK